MVVLLTGATGFIGRHLKDALLAAGHEVVCAVRGGRSNTLDHPRVRYVHADFTTDLDPASWAPRLAGIDAVVNAVGILRERGRQTFEAIHTRAPQALFAACAAAGARRVIQISALGADESARSRYHLSKKGADDFLATLPLDWSIVQPSIVFGTGGLSARMFTMMASLPLTPVPGRGEQQLQPVHIEDVVQTILSLLESREDHRRRFALVGPEPLGYKVFLARLRRALGLGPLRAIPIPMVFMHLGAWIGKFLPNAQLDPETLDMLIRGNTADPADTRWILRREPRGVESFIPKNTIASTVATAKLQWLLPILRSTVGIVWLVTGILSLGIYPVFESYALLERVGASATIAPTLLYGAAMLDLFFGITMLAMVKWRWLWIAQIVVILSYTLIITLKLPEYWLHPYGPILKNLPMLAAIWLLYELEPHASNT